MRAVIITGILFGITLLLMLAGYPLAMLEHSWLSVGDHFHIWIQSYEWQSNIYFFNWGDYGPYRGSIIDLDEGTLVKERAFGHAVGIYFRYFRWNDGNKLWTLTISMWWPAGIFGCAFAIAALREYRRRNTSLATIDQPPTDQ